MKHLFVLFLGLCSATAAYAEARMLHIEQNGATVDNTSSCQVQRSFGDMSPESRQRTLTFWNTVDRPYWSKRLQLKREADAAQMQHAHPDYQGPNPQAYFADQARKRNRISRDYGERIRQMDRDHRAKYQALTDSMTLADRDAARADMAIVTCPVAPRR